jgi:hypothetical protein
MTLAEAIETLKAFQAWRKGADIPQLKPSTVSEAIEIIIKELEK